MENFGRGMNVAGEFILAAILNLFYGILFILPMIMADLLLHGNLLHYPLFFIPLAALCGFALQGLSFAAYRVVIEKDDYAGPHFWRSVGDGFGQHYLFYLILTAVCFFSLPSVLFLTDRYSPAFYGLFCLLLLFLMTQLFYGLIQLTFYEGSNLLQIARNSLILCFSQIPISIAATLLFSIALLRFAKNPLSGFFTGFSLIAAFILLVRHGVFSRFETAQSSVGEEDGANKEE